MWGSQGAKTAGVSPMRKVLTTTIKFCPGTSGRQRFQGLTGLGLEGLTPTCIKALPCLAQNLANLV